MTSWTKSKALSQRTHRVTSWGLQVTASYGGAPKHPGGLGGHLGPCLSRSQPLSAGPAPLLTPTHRFCVADGLYRQSAPEFRVASSVEQLNIIEVGAKAERARAAAGRAGRKGPVPRGRPWRQSLAPTASCPHWPGHHWREVWGPAPLMPLRASSTADSSPEEGLDPTPPLESKMRNL